MNYYERHIGDYLKDTAHLSLLEHGVYARLLDVYYTREGGIPDREAARLIGARSKDEREALAAVLEEFFTLVDGVHVQDRCEREVARFQDKQRKAKASADARWSKAPEQSERNANADANASPDAMRTHTEGNAPRARPQTPDTRHQAPEEKKTPHTPQGVAEPAGFARFWQTWPSGERKGGRAKCLELWRRAKLEPDADLIVAHVEAMKATAKWREDGGAYVPAPTTYLNGRRWDGAELNGHGADTFAGAL